MVELVNLFPRYGKPKGIYVDQQDVHNDLNHLHVTSQYEVAISEKSLVEYGAEGAGGFLRDGMELCAEAEGLTGPLLLASIFAPPTLLPRQPPPALWNGINSAWVIPLSLPRQALALSGYVPQNII